jgi:hypothetical protein
VIAIRETVELPEGDSRLHPLDVPAARRVWLRAWLVRRLALPAVLLGLMGLMLLHRGEAFVVADAALLIWAGARIGAWLLYREAWAYIPRRRADFAARPAPLRWVMIDAHITAVLAVAVGLAVMHWFGSGPDGQTRAFILGTWLAAGVVWAAEIGYRAGRRQWRKALTAVPFMCALAGLDGFALLGLPHGGHALWPYVATGAEATGGVYVIAAAMLLSVRRARTRFVAVAAGAPAAPVKRGWSTAGTVSALASSPSTLGAEE